ncbi:MAG TPA: Lrp/AsnC family transcriptional regulator [Candidatus Nanoarchaeia archaeon]|nr:Lrp/AsnC family transcriptional regulator [Candidatus Nanoarchaeia archaeon]
MDNKNKTILQRYTDNPRITASQLSSELKLSKNAVLERIKTLKKKKIILGSTCFPNYFKLGFSQYLLFISSQKIFSDKNFLKDLDLDPVIEILSLLGKYNLYIKFISPSEHHKQSFIEKIINTLEVEDYELIQIKYYDLIPAKKYKSEAKEIPLLYNPSNEKQKLFELDKIDLKILEEITKNSEQSLAIIADKLKISAQVIAYRFKRLIKKQIIIRFYGYTDIFSQNLQLYFLRFELVKPTESLSLFKKFILDQCIQDISILEHKQSFFCTLEAETRKDMLDSIQNLIKINKNVKSIEIDIFLDQIYYNFFPDIIKQKLSEKRK